MTPEQAKQLYEIHATVVRGMPSSEALRAAAQEVVSAYYGNLMPDNAKRMQQAIRFLEAALEENQG